jgi:hypothetical protein
MNRPPRGVDHAIARFDEVMNRIDRGAYREAQRRQYSRSATAARPSDRQCRHGDRRAHRRHHHLRAWWSARSALAACSPSPP